MTTPTDEQAAPRLVTIEQIREAEHGLGDVAVRTPLVEVAALSRLAKHPVYLKLESRQPSGAFKLRGAWTAVRRLPDEIRRAGVITYSSGNHGQAVAYAARQVGIRSVIVMPETATAFKIDGVRRWGGEIVLAGTTSEDRLARAQEIVEREKLTVIPPFDHPDVVAGQGTVGLEIVEDLPDVVHVAVPVGGGGLAAGVATAVSALRPEARITAVEPEGAAAYAAALEAGHPVRLERTTSVADGLLPLSVGAFTFEHMKHLVRSVTIPDSAIVEATQWLFNEAEITAEPSGAATTAALRCGALQVEGPTVLVVSGGNVDVATIPSLEAAT